GRVDDESRDHEWIERIVKIAGALGMNPVRVRWKLMRWQGRQEEQRRASEQKSAHVRYAHAVCPECGRIQPRGTKECSGCGARMPFLYMVTGVLAFVPGYLLWSRAPSVGASGAIMGLIGVAAGWGQRHGTTQGLAIRNRMLQWLLYTTLFGLMMRVDHLAHFTGFAVGAVLGYALFPQRRSAVPTALDVVLGTIGIASAIACVVVI